MKLIKPEELLKLPEETIFSVYWPTSKVFGVMYIKGKTYENGLLKIQPLSNTVEASTHHEASYKINDAIVNGSSYGVDFNCPDTVSLETLVPEGALVAAWEQEDFLKFYKRMTTIMNVFIVRSHELVAKAVEVNKNADAIGSVPSLEL